jgi:DNA polymerase III delta prime subunit
MALSAVQPAMNLEEGKKPHPFFSRPSSMLSQSQIYTNTNSSVGSNAHEPKEPATEPSTEEAHDDPDYEREEHGALKVSKKRGRKPGSKNKAKTDNALGTKKQPSLEHFTRRLNGSNVDQEAAIIVQDVTEEQSVEEDPNQGRRKRRKTESPRPTSDGADAVETMDWHQQLQDEAGGNQTQQADVANGEPAISQVEQTQPQKRLIKVTRNGKLLPSPPPAEPTQPEVQPEALQRPMTPPIAPNDLMVNIVPENNAVPSKPKATTPKKSLKVTKNGKLMSSPPPKAQPEFTTPRKRRTRKTSKAKVSPTVTIIKYGSDATSRRSLGDRIDAIMNGKKSTHRPVSPKKQNLPSRPSGPPKPTHPFFTGKVAQKSDEVPLSNSVVHSISPRAQKKSAVTPGKLKTESRSYQSSAPVPTFGLGFGNDRMSKQTGVGEAPWPSQGTAHVRSLDTDALAYSSITPDSSLLKERKLKNSILDVPQEENLITTLAKQLGPSVRGFSDPVAQFEPPADVRLPSRLLTTGRSVQDKVRSQVRVTLPPFGAPSKAHSVVHPAIKTLFLDIEDTLTPFDVGQCEVQSWTSKYAPKDAEHVLQSGKEAMTLSDWLTNLTVLAVGGKHGGPKGPDIKKPAKKRRKRAVDDFIVDSNEESEEEMVEVDNGDEHQSANLRSIRRQRWMRNKNVVVVSGPSGCGKSAMVHAVAKGLGFEVFEINPGSRRSGKDIQDKVGDMSENHLVNHKRNDVSNKPDTASGDDTDAEQQAKALQEDITSGRQSTMASFFKAKGTKNNGSTAKSKAPEPRKTPKSAQSTLPVVPAQRNSQKQSLILFEEADILFEEDQNFWSHVTKLASQSKRPIVITCNNEASILREDLPLGAILRLTPPPIDLATDYMLVLAGREGHILGRDAITSLYKLKGQDLRASITELNLWCQMSVGDRKGGLEWMYQRWPPGKDVDEQGRFLRVASEDTYLPGMGCLSHNVFESPNTIAFDKQDELMKETWADWGINPSKWARGDEQNEEPSVEKSPLEQLRHLDALSDSMSAADIYSRIDLPSYERDNHRPTDSSLPPLREKERLNYTISDPIMQTDHITDFSNLDTNIFVQSHLLMRRAYKDVQGSFLGGTHAIPRTEAGFTEAILSHRQNILTKPSLTRPDFSEAFDALAYPPDTLPATYTSYNLTPSSFDRTFRVVVEDVAPYVRSVVAHELVLERQRIRLGNLLSEGGRGKRTRTTRAARTAMEGGDRKTKRREQWFDKNLNRTMVMDTAGKAWSGMGSGAVGTETDGSVKTAESGPASQE